MRLLLALLLALLPMPALADVTATYSIDKEVLTIEVDDGGYSRVDYAGFVTLIRRDGVDYLVVQMTGTPKVAKFAEVVALTLASGPQAPSPGILGGSKIILTAKGETIVGGRPATLWSFGPEGSIGKDDLRDMLDIAMSADPMLAPIGALFRRSVDALLPFFAIVLPESTGFAAGARELLAKGTPLRIGKKFELQSVGTGEIDHKRFDLPAPVIGAAEFLEAMEGPGSDFAPPPLP